MKKNAFTLTELLAVIAILSVVSIIAVPQLFRAIKSNNIDSYNSLVKDITLAAESYANNHGGILVQIPLSELQLHGYLQSNITNPVDNSIMNGCVYLVDGDTFYKEEACSTYITGLKSTITVPIVENTCSFENGYVWEFDYTGDVQEFIVPCDGTYKVEVWGASAPQWMCSNGKGGYATGNTILSKDSTLYIACGGTNGYNGGGTGSGTNYPSGGTRGAGVNGGGATHISKVDGTLSTIGYTEFVVNNQGLIIAGGAGGSGGKLGWNSEGDDDDKCMSGGYGGGLSGGNAQTGGSSNGAGGNQNASISNFGQGANGTGGGGGGYVGGGGGYWGAGGGGSGWIDGVTDGETIAGNASMPTHDGASTMTGNSGNGYAKITLIGF